MKNSCFSIAILLLCITQSLGRKNLNSTTDEYALLAFKDTLTSDTHGVLSNNWFTNTSICSWTGVSCGSKHHRVTALNVSGLGLIGPISPHLGNLTFLRSLDISSNNFTGPIPSELSNLRRLEQINLSENQITGSIPNGMFNISSLIEINMRYNRLSGKIPNDHICNNVTPKLKRIYLSGNQLYGEIPANINKCIEMEDLRLVDNHFSGNIPSEIGSLIMLIKLSLASNNFEGSIPFSIFNISSLEFIYLFDNKLSGSIPTDTYNLPDIEGLYLYENHLTGGIPKQLGNLTTLSGLDLSSNQLTGELPQELGNLAYVEDLQACFNELSGSIPSSIFNLSMLNKLALQQNLFSGSLPSDMGLSIFSLTELYIYFNRLSGEIPSSITNASMLTVLELNRNSFSGFIPDFGNLRHLETLRLWDNKLKGAKSPTQELRFLSSLTNCRHLKFLEISDNPLNGVLPTSIGNLSTFLVRFWASSCNIMGSIPSEIGNLKSLQGLYLSGNMLTGFIPKSIGELKQLHEIYLDGNHLEGYIPYGVCQMSDLVVLNLSVNNLIGPILECLGEVKSLRTVLFASNKLNSTIPSKLWDLVDVVTLDLSSNSLSGNISSRIGSWKINKLNLSFNKFLGDIPSSIGSCESLEFLSLSNNMFEGSIPESLGRVNGLRTLDLSNNNLSGSIPMSLEKLHVLEDFNVSYNKLDGEIPNGGCFANFTAQSFVHNFALCGATRFQVRPCKNNDGRSVSKRIALVMKYIVPSFVATIILVVVIAKLIRRRKQIKLPPTSISLEKVEWRRISYVELIRGTNSFSETNLLGRGSFGSVFKAVLSDGLYVAVKVFNLQLEGANKSFDTESEILSSIRHRNLVPIIGCCANIEFKALILKYMTNGSLEKWLYSDNNCLDLVQRLKIAIDVALALEYLHHGHTFPVVHCDIKPNNILLDEDMTAHVADFGISKLFYDGETMIQTNTLATIGYAAPEYGTEGIVSVTGDVYSYGIVLLEMFTRKRPTDDMFSDEMTLKLWVSKALQENAITDVLDPTLLSTEDQHLSAKEECVSSIFKSAMKCLVVSPDERINMIEVAAALSRIKAKFLLDTTIQASSAQRTRRTVP